MALAEAPPAHAGWETVRGFGGGAGTAAWLVRPTVEDEVRAAVTGPGAAGSPGAASGLIARGLGRSYGDAAQLAGGCVLDMTAMDAFELDATGGLVTASAGASIGALLRRVLPAGWMLPVVPGTQHVTVGGAIASDVHGKNHPSAGSFGAHVRALGLLTAGGEVHELEPGGERFEATVGGMGLTGVILWARIALEPVGSQFLAVDTTRVRCLDDALALLRPDAAARHRVAWLDLLGPRPGRGILTSSEHMGEPSPSPRPPGAAPLTVPERWPAGLLRAGTVRALNELRYRRAPRGERGRPQPLTTHMFPLDSLEAWPRLYGPAGLLQYQFAVPHGEEPTLEAVISGLGRARVPCFLATLKALGEAPGGPLSFPLAGWTLALDLPAAAAGVGRMLDAFDELVAEAGGRVYLTKDARLRPEALRAMYPRLAQWQRVRDAIDPDRLWRSDLSRRTGLTTADGR
ncbi:MAG: decaprenylphospho-beta-D-ribofuranose 2-oxidase [Solirubrobacteraceae bacterium]|nr:decaprenylphospho-beta-D-ribofuranose 2-oxidase [Solirubrobacteraceae bacterium]